MRTFRIFSIPLTALVFFCWGGNNLTVLGQSSSPEGYYLFGGPGIEQGKAVTVLHGGGGYAVAGDARESQDDDWDILILRLDESCHSVWQKRIAGEGEDHVWGIEGVRDGGVVISGSTTSFGAVETDIYVVKLDDSGVEEWSRLLGGPGVQGRGSVLETPEGELLIAGWTRSEGWGDFYAAKLSAGGEVIWERTYDHWHLEGVNDIALTPDGMFLLYGEGTSSNGDDMNGQLVVVDTDGELQQRYCLPEGIYREGYGIAVTGDGRCAFTGPARTERGFRGYVAGLGRAGEETWSGYYPSEGWTIGFGLCAPVSGGFLMVGWGRTGDRAADAVLVRIDDSGSELWTRHLGGEEDENGLRVIETPAGGFLVVGTTGSFGAGSEDILVIHTGPDGYPTIPGYNQFAQVNEPYLGEEPPGFTPRLFAPGIISTDSACEFGCTFSPDGTEFYFSRRAGQEPPKFHDGRNTIMVCRWEGDHWTKPVVASFSGRYPDHEPAIPPGGQRLLFGSSRPHPDPGISYDIWMVQRRGTQWTSPRVADFPVAMFITFASDGTACFGGDGGICMARPEGDGYGESEPIGIHGGHPAVSPDGSYIVFDREERTEDGWLSHLYLTVRSHEGIWSDPVLLDERLPASRSHSVPYITRDGHYLFFTSDGYIWWVSTRALFSDRGIRMCASY